MLTTMGWSVGVIQVLLRVETMLQILKTATSRFRAPKSIHYSPLTSNLPANSDETLGRGSLEA